MKLLLGVCALFTAVPLWGTNISVSCATHPYTGTEEPVSLVDTSDTEANCRISPSSAYPIPASASAQLSLILASNPADYSILSTSQSAASYPGSAGSNHPYGPGSEARTSINFQDTLTTAGPLRAGYVQIIGTGTGSPFLTRVTMTSGIITYKTSPLGPPYSEFTCGGGGTSFDCFPGPGYYPTGSILLPIVLGSPFQIEAVGQINSYADGSLGSSGGTVSTTYEFRLREADNGTPVAVFEAIPEPATYGLCGLALAAYGAYRKRSQRY